MKDKKRHRVYLVKKHPFGENYLGICLFGFVFSVRPLNTRELNHGKRLRDYALTFIV